MIRPAQPIKLAFFARLLLPATIALLSGAASAQAPKVGDYYKDSTELGFRIRTPKDWEFTPPNPDEVNLIGKYEDRHLKSIQLGSDWDSTLWLHVWLVQFDTREKEEAPETEKEGVKVVRIGRGAENIDEWLEQNVDRSLRKVEEDTTKVDKCTAVELQYEGEVGGEPFRVYAMVYELEPGRSVAIVGNGPGEAKKWRKYETSFKRMAKSFSRIEVSRAIDLPALGSGSLRAQKRAKLQADVARAPGWELYESDNYFIVTDNDDKAFIKELIDRLEAIRKTYEELYPPSLADEIRDEAARERARKIANGEAEDDDKPDPGERRTTARKADPMEQSRCSVVRVCSDQGMYHSYGGPGGSAGYWASFHEELVIYDDKAGGGRRDTWNTLNHEAFHQYIFYFFGNLAPHSWYNEGHGDFFSGYQLKNNRFTLKKNDWRESTIKEAIREGSFVPLDKIVRYTQGDYYSNAGLCYAQGWSMVYFLRTGKQNGAPNWQDSWDGILDTYLRVLATTNDLDAAVDEAFKDVDWKAMTESWKAYIG